LDLGGRTLPGPFGFIGVVGLDVAGVTLPGLLGFGGFAASGDL
jgi:hypothetical protein